MTMPLVLLTVIKLMVVETKLTIVGNYNDPSDFEWKNQYTLRRPLGNVDVKDNYNIIFDLHVQILPADIDYNSFGYIGEYDGAGHKISVTVNAPLTFLIEYSEDNVTYSTAPIVKSAIGEYTVYFKITAPNCKEVISSNLIKINPATSAPGPASIDPRLYFNPKYTYDLNPYMTGDLQKNHPYLTEIPNGVKQVITYYNSKGVEIGKEEFIPGVTDVYNTLSGYKPVNVGIYYFKIEVEAYTDGNGSHQAETVGLQPFFIVSDGTPYPPNNPSYYPPDENAGLIEFVPIWVYDDDEYMHTDSHKNPWYKGSLVYDEVIVKYYDEADTALANEIPHPINVGYYKFTLELKNAGTSVYVSNPQKFYITGNGNPSGPTPGGGSGTGTNNGNVYYIPEYEYDGGYYMNNDSSYTDPHYVGTLSTGAQTVTYYAGTDTGCTTPISKPTDVGEYIFVINVAADSTYPAFSSNPQSFKIVPHVITVTWTDTVVTYDGTPQTAKATGVDDLNGNATINFDVIIAETNVGTYTNQALFPATFTNASNYKIDPNTATSPFEIKPKKIDKPVYENLTFMYFRDEIRIELDVPDPANLPNTVAVVAVLDSTGAVTELRKKSDDSVFDAAPDLGYKFQIIKGDANADVTVLAFALSEQHQFIATLDDPNYVWSDSNDKVAFTTVFTIIPYDFDDPTALYQLVVTPQNAYEIYTGTAFAQIPTVERVEIANTTNRFTLVDTTTAPRYKEYDVAYPGDHTNVGFATIEVTCCNNYIGTAQATYEIKAKPPALLEIEDGTSQGATGASPFVFMNVAYDSMLNQLNLEEDWSVTGSNVRDATAIASTSNHFVLNHVHQEMNVDQILAQFKNDVNYLEVLDKNGNVMPKGGITYVGTGCKVVLYDDTNVATRNIVDEIDIVIYGDTSGDGRVNATDVGIIVDALNAGWVYGDGNLTECQYMAMMVYRQDGNGNPVKNINATQAGTLVNALNVSDDVNINYVI